MPPSFLLWPCPLRLFLFWVYRGYPTIVGGKLRARLLTCYGQLTHKKRVYCKRCEWVSERVWVCPVHIPLDLKPILVEKNGDSDCTFVIKSTSHLWRKKKRVVGTHFISTPLDPTQTGLGSREWIVVDQSTQEIGRPNVTFLKVNRAVRERLWPWAEGCATTSIFFLSRVCVETCAPCSIVPEVNFLAQLSQIAISLIFCCSLGRGIGVCFLCATGFLMVHGLPSSSSFFTDERWEAYASTGDNSKKRELGCSFLIKRIDYCQNHMK